MDKQLTVGQLMDMLAKCDRDMAVVTKHIRDEGGYFHVVGVAWADAGRGEDEAEVRILICEDSDPPNQ